jgi:hypothetical protein
MSSNNNKSTLIIYLLLVSLFSATQFQYLHESMTLLQDARQTQNNPIHATHHHGRHASNSYDKNASSASTTSSSQYPGSEIVETFVISLDSFKFDQFVIRNNHSRLDPITWIPGVDGFQQVTLNQWGKLIGKPPLNVTHFVKGNQEHKDLYASPHAVGCYMAHWHLIRMLHQRPSILHPELYLILEDDAACIPRLIPRLLHIARRLPSDWDLFYIAGKPITYFQDPHNQYNASWSKDRLETEICQGRFGMGESPRNPYDDSRTFSRRDNNNNNDLPFWKTYYMTNTHAYVVNPRRIHHVMQVLRPNRYIPIDVLLANAMKNKQLQVYMSTEQWCESTDRMRSEWGIFDDSLTQPVTWRGFLAFVQKQGEWFEYEYRRDIRIARQPCTY